MTCGYTEESKMDDVEIKEQLTSLSKKYQCNYLQNFVSHCLFRRDVRMARICLLGTIDGLLERNEILVTHAKIAYNIIGFSPEEESAVRQEPIRL